MQRTLLTLCLVSGVVLLLVGVYLGLDLVRQRRSVHNEAKEVVRRQAVNTASGLNEELERYAKLAGDLASELGAGSLNAQELAPRLKRDLDAHPNLHSLGVAYTPSKVGSGRRLFAPYGERRGNELSILQLEDTMTTRPPSIGGS